LVLPQVNKILNFIFFSRSNKQLYFPDLNDSDEYHQPLLPYGMLIFGGFDGRLKSDVLVYIVGICTSLATKEQCLTAMPGVKCVWNKAAKKCEPLASVSKEGYEKCPGLGNWNSTFPLLFFLPSNVTSKKSSF
jgi:hypothetical protein